MAMVNVLIIAAYRRIAQADWLGPKEGRHLALVLQSGK